MGMLLVMTALIVRGVFICPENGPDGTEHVGATRAGVGSSPVGGIDEVFSATVSVGTGVITVPFPSGDIVVVVTAPAQADIATLVVTSAPKIWIQYNQECNKTFYPL